MSRVAGLAVVLVVLIGRYGFADDQADAQPPVVVQEASEDSEADGDSHGDRPTAPSAVRQEHIIYLPFEKLSEVFGQEDASILLPYAKYLEMWNRLTRPEPLPIGPPVEFGDAAVGSAVSEDGTVLLRGAGQGRYELLVQGQGRHTIRLNLVAGVQTAAEGRSFTLQCQGQMKVVAFIEPPQGAVIEKILRHCGLWHPSTPRAPPPEDGWVYEPDADWGNQPISSEQSGELTYVDINEFLATLATF